MYWTLLFLAAATTFYPCLTRASKRIPSYAGPYIPYTDRFWDCEGDTFRVAMRVSHFKPFKPYEKQRITGSFNISSTVNDTWWARAVLDIRSNNQWKENFFVFNYPTGACSVFSSNIPSLFRIVFKTDGKKKPCRISPGYYAFANESVDWTFPNFPIMPYGHYRLTFTGGRRNSKTMGLCLGVECHIIPQP